MLYLGLGPFAVCVIALDQVVKYLVVAHISLGGIVPVMDGVLHLTYVRNTGASFSMLAGSRWLFVGVLGTVHRNPCGAALEEAAD